MTFLTTSASGAAETVARLEALAIRTVTHTAATTPVAAAVPPMGVDPASIAAAASFAADAGEYISYEVLSTEELARSGVTVGAQQAAYQITDTGGAVGVGI